MNVNRQEKAAHLRRTRGLLNLVPSPPVTDHTRRLLAAGWTRREIATRAGLERRTINSVAVGERPTVHRYTAGAIVKLRPQDAPARVLPHGTVRRVQALALMGWPATQIAAEAGLSRSFMGDMMSGRLRRIPREAAAAVAAVFRARWQDYGPSSIARTVAARNGWVSVWAWDDIDDPTEQPAGVVVSC